MKEEFKSKLIELSIEELMKKSTFEDFQKEAEEIEQAFCFACSIVAERKGWDNQRKNQNELSRR